MSWIRVCAFAIIAAGVVACGAEEPATPENVERAITEEVERQTGMEPAQSREPCELLDDDFLRAHFEVAEGVEIRRSPSKYSPHPLCTVSWDKPNAAELEQKQAEEMMERMQARMRGEEVPPATRSTNEVSLTLYEPAFDDASAAMSAFDSSMKRLSEGITASHEDVEMTFQADLVPVDGVGDKAMWAARMHQISVVDGNRIFHVTVNTGSESDMEKARDVAAQVAQRL